MAERQQYPGAPRWVKVFALVAGIVLLVVAVILVTGIGGPHGPGRHLPESSVELPLSGDTTAP